MKKLIAPILILVMLLCLAAPAAAEGDDGDGMVVHPVEGRVVVRDPGGSAAEAEGDVTVASGYTVETRNGSCAYIYLDESKTVKLDMNTVVTVSRSGPKVQVDLLAGQLVFLLNAPLGSS